MAVRVIGGVIIRGGGSIPRIHRLQRRWIAGSSPAMTSGMDRSRVWVCLPRRRGVKSATALIASSQGCAAFSAAARTSGFCFCANSSSGMSLTPPALATMCHLIASTGSARMPRPTARMLASRFCATALPLRAAFCRSAAAAASSLATPVPLNSAMAYSTAASVLSPAVAAASQRAASLASFGTPRPSL